jgi:hypothetical protein
MPTRTYDITVAGEAVPAITAAFEEFDIIVHGGRTTLRSELPDQAALQGALERVMALGLVLLKVQIVEGEESSCPGPSGGSPRCG